MTEEGPDLERTNMLWPPALKEAVREKVGARGLTEFTIGAVEQRLLHEDRVRDLEKEVGHLRYLSQLLADRVAMGGDHEDRNHLLMEVELPSWMKTDGWPTDMKGLVPAVPPKVTKVYSDEELAKPMTAVGAEQPKPALIHVADRKTGDTTPLCRHEYAGHEGPCEPPFEPVAPGEAANEVELGGSAEVVVQTEEAKDVFKQAGDDLFSRIQTKAAEKGVDISGAGLVPASTLPKPDVHNHSLERREDGNLYCTGCYTWIDESTSPGTLHEDPTLRDEVPTEPAPVLEVQTAVPTPVAPPTEPAYTTRDLSEIEDDF